MTTGQFGTVSLWVGAVMSLITIALYLAGLFAQERGGENSSGLERTLRLLARGSFTLTAAGVLSAFYALIVIVYNNKYQYEYAFSHTGNELRALPTDTFAHALFHHWIRLAATWSGQEGSFLLWSFWTVLIGFLVFAKAGRYEMRVMPIFTTVITFLCLILIKQTPFHYLKGMPDSDWTSIPPDGRGLTPSLQNYWMTIHPPTIFFGFASLAVPYSYAVAAMIWKDYKGWITRVMPYALLTSATLGLGLFMGGYWAYETQGWHGFWGWDPVENASFFPWLAITALVHGLVVQKSRGGMARTNTFLGVLAFWLFLLGTFLTRSGALSGEAADGSLLSVHAFDNISKSGLFLMEAMLTLYGLSGLILWLVRIFKMPARSSMGDSLLSRDFAFFVSIMLMILACAVIAFGTTTPLFMSWMHRKPTQPQPFFYNQVMFPLAILASLALGCVPWLAWKRTDSEKFLRKLLVPWLLMVVFGFFMIFWVQGATADLQQAMPDDHQATLHYWFGATAQRVLVVLMCSLGMFVALSNSMLTYKVLRVKPISAGGWLAHVGIGVLLIGIVISNTFERTVRISVIEGEPAKELYGYKISMEGMTGTPKSIRPIDASTDAHNSVKLRITPPGVDDGKSSSLSGSDLGEAKTFVMEPRWFLHNLNKAFPWKWERMRWPAIHKDALHDLYIGLADDAQYEWPFGTTYSSQMAFTLTPGQKVDVGGYRIGYYEPILQPQKLIGARIVILPIDENGKPKDKPVLTEPALRMMANPDFAPSKPMDEMNRPMQMFAVNEDIPELKDTEGNIGAIEAIRLDPATKAFSFRLSLPNFRGRWNVPLEVTYKPWINLVWLGVFITVGGTLLAMFRRIGDASKVDSKTNKGKGDKETPDDTEGGSGTTTDSDEIVDGQPWDLPDAPTSTVPDAVLPIVNMPVRGKLRTAK